jgi:hypothetical protein
VENNVYVGDARDVKYVYAWENGGGDKDMGRNSL